MNRVTRNVQIKEGCAGTVGIGRVLPLTVALSERIYIVISVLAGNGAIRQAAMLIRKWGVAVKKSAHALEDHIKLMRSFMHCSISDTSPDCLHQ